MKNEFENVGNHSCTRNETKSQSKSGCTACVRAGGPRETQQKLVMVECCCKNMCRKACGKRSEPGPRAKCQGSFAILPMKNIPNIMETLSQLDGSLSICTYVRRKMITNEKWSRKSRSNERRTLSAVPTSSRPINVSFDSSVGDFWMPPFSDLVVNLL